MELLWNSYETLCMILMYDYNPNRIQLMMIQILWNSYETLLMYY